jgi:integral membrane protein
MSDNGDAVTDGFMGGASLLSCKQPPVSAATVAKASGALTRYRVMAFVTGFVLIAGTISLILKYATSLDMEPVTGYLWVAHGYLYLVYVIITGMLGVKLRWPLARYALVMLAGTIPTMSFVAEHYVTRATRNAAATDDQPVSARD